MIVFVRVPSVTSSRQITEVKQFRARLVLGYDLDEWLVLESGCRPCVEALGKPLIS